MLKKAKLLVDKTVHVACTRGLGLDLRKDMVAVAMKFHCAITNHVLLTSVGVSQDWTEGLPIAGQLQGYSIASFDDAVSKTNRMETVLKFVPGKDLLTVSIRLFGSHGKFLGELDCLIDEEKKIVPGFNDRELAKHIEKYAPA